jgi:hypothetical protein
MIFRHTFCDSFHFAYYFNENSEQFLVTLDLFIAFMELVPQTVVNWNEMFLSIHFRDHPSEGLLCSPGEDVWVWGALESAFQLL